MIPSLSLRITGRPVRDLMQRPHTAQGSGLRCNSLLRTIWLGVARGCVIIKSPYVKPLQERAVMIIRVDDVHPIAVLGIFSISPFQGSHRRACREWRPRTRQTLPFPEALEKSPYRVEANPGSR